MSGEDDETFLPPRIVYFVLKLTDFLPGLVLSIFSELENPVKCPHHNLEARTSLVVVRAIMLETEAGGPHC